MLRSFRSAVTVLRHRAEGLGLSTQRGSTTNNKEDPIPDIPSFYHNKLLKKYSDTLTSNARAQSRLEMSYTTLFDAKLHAEGRYNLRGGLERLAGVAASIGKIANKSTTAMLQDITQLAEFKVALSSVCAKEKLKPDQVEKTCKSIYSQLSQHFHGNDESMTIDKEVFCPLEIGALLCFFEVQKNWPDPISFVVIPGKSGELGGCITGRDEDE
ncbi:hypothetical protein BDD12DRAFT_911898 [Trichophaea hybrida]|nr:hypothetical protein BDD12DRAFT_911898 [Trichophaea hybrida]